MRRILLSSLAALLFSNSVFCAETNVHVLSGGFTVRELPIKLSNINNLRFSPEGNLTALGYDGRIHILRDTDGDGLEDAIVPFWDKPTLKVPVGMAWSQEGLYVSSQGKVSLLRDTDKDGKADVEEIIASGWPRTDVGSGGVDATAVTLDDEGNLYFGLLTADYSNPYRVKDGIARYDLNGKRGTIQKWSRKTKSLETIASGIRVPYTLAFSRAKDLFVTDQEGETWCPGGNPLDELNQIIPGRNYGFPPRHEKYLPTLNSEPPVVAFGPQHQSSCGLVFNEPSARQKRFGPGQWEGNAFVAGESRGKIWRVQLVKTPFGYVGRESIFARLDMLTTDVAISPQGDLYVSCHSGRPDWGTGPNGIGKIFKISLTEPAAPQVIQAWAADAMKVHVAFDQPLNPRVTNDPSAIRIEFGEYVRAADRFEKLQPPYKAVLEQNATPRGRLRVVSAALSPDGRTLVLHTDPHPQAVSYALTIPGVQGSSGEIATVDTSYALNGVEATLSSEKTLKTWLPHLDSDVNRAFLTASAEQRPLLAPGAKGKLELRSQIVLPDGASLLRLQGSTPFRATLRSKTYAAGKVSGNRFVADLDLKGHGAPELIVIQLEPSAGEFPSLHAGCYSASDPTLRPLPLESLLLPWAPAHQRPPPPSITKSELAGGDYENGRSLFFGERLRCAGCHRIRGEGAILGPDLGNLSQRDPSSVLRDITEPSLTINPDYVAYEITLRTGDDLLGFVRAQTKDLLAVTGPDGKERSVRTDAVKEMRPSALSLMPEKLLEGLKEAQVRDLLTFVTTEPPRRSATDLQQVLLRRTSPEKSPPGSPRPLNIVLVASKQDHGAGQHDYPAWQKNWLALLQRGTNLAVSEAWEWPSPVQFSAADVIVFYFWNHEWTEERFGQLEKFLQQGRGVGFFHAAVIADKEPQKLADHIGLAAQPGPTKYRHTPFVLKFTAPTNHPITTGFSDLKLLDEPYWPMIGDPKRVDVLATAEVDGTAWPMIWTLQKGRGRIFASIVGHYTWTFEDPLFRVLALRGIAWAAGEQPERLQGL